MHDTCEAREVAVQVDDHHGRQRRIEAARDMQQHAAVAVGGVLPINAAARGGVAAPAVLLDVVEGLVLPGRLARVRERRIVEGDQLGPRRGRLCRVYRVLHGRAHGNDRQCQAREQMATAGGAHVTPGPLSPAQARAAREPQRSRRSPAGRHSR